MTTLQARLFAVGVVLAVAGRVVGQDVDEYYSRNLFANDQVNGFAKE
jgi:hypothetical protein